MSANAAALAPSYRERGRSLTDLALSFSLVLLALGLLATGVFLVTGGKALIVRSGSMEPAIGVGDLVMTKTIRPTDVEVGEVISFSDPTRSGTLVTHRVRKMQDLGGRIAFVTKGDTNGGVERWTIARSGSVGRLIFTIPKLGQAVSWAAEPSTRFGLLVGGALLIAYSVLRRIWSD
ncbi:MAG: signal peptidase I [Actinomycetota bacterium]|nr:signal peptidase I [Actinomycetota bacterium]